MSYPINYPTPQGANVQIFYRSNDWVKPQGASFVWFTLIGGGGTGDGATGGGCGAVTNCMVPAFLIPDVLRVNVSLGDGGSGTTVEYQQKAGTSYTLLTANAASQSTAASATASNFFSCMGIYQSVAGVAGSVSSVTASSTTFLSVGGAAASAQTSNYGYSSGAGGPSRVGLFQLSPIIVGTGGMGTGRGGIGCGAGINQLNFSSPGLAVIITW